MADEGKVIENLDGETPSFSDYENLPPGEIRKMIEKEGQVEPQAEEPTEAQEKAEAPSPTAEEGQAEAKKEEEPTSEDLILGKFKTNEEVLKAYQELEKKSTRDAQLRSQYRETMSPYVDFDDEGNVIGLKPNAPVGSQTAATQPQQTGQTQDEVVAMLEQRYNALEQQYGPVRANLIMQAEIANAITQKALSPVDELKAERIVENQKARLRASRSDFAQLEGEIDKYLGRMDTKSKSNPAAVETVYYIVRGRKLEDMLKAKEEEARLKSAEIEDQKVKAQVEHQTKTPEEPSIDIENASAEELRKHLGLTRMQRY
jgi:hypothetical protein